MNLSNTIPTADFLRDRPDRDGISIYHSKIYDKLIERFDPLPAHIEGADYGSLTEVGSFLIGQGVLVEILECEYESEKSPIYLIDIAHEVDAHNLTYLSDGSARKFQLILHATDFKDAVQGVSQIMIDTY